MLQMTYSRRLQLLTAVLLGTIGCDQGTKHWAQSSVMGAGTHLYLGGLFRLQYAENPGAFLSMGAGLPLVWRTAILGLGVGLILALALGAYFLWKDIDRIGAWGLALVLSGGLSNLFDRLFRDGRVIDFLNVGVGYLRTGIFNVADIAVMVGVALLAWSSWFVRRSANGKGA